MIPVFIENDDGAHDLFASVTDQNTNPPSIPRNDQNVPFVNLRINKGTHATAIVQEDGNGNCLLNIHAVSADDSTVQKDFNNQVAQANQTISVDVF